MTADKFAKAMSHPLRVKLIELFSTQGPLSASQASMELMQPLGNVSYHVRILRRLGFLRETSRRAVRGSIETFLELDIEALTKAQEKWSNVI